MLAVARWNCAWINKSRVERHDETETSNGRIKGNSRLRYRNLAVRNGDFDRRHRHERRRDADSAICAMACLSSALFNPSYDSSRKSINPFSHRETRDWNSSSNTNYRPIGGIARARNNRIKLRTRIDWIDRGRGERERERGYWKIRILFARFSYFIVNAVQTERTAARYE